MTERKRKPEAGQTEVQGALKERILGKDYAGEFELRKREVHVMTRLSSDIVEILDALVELEVFKSRSEAVSALVEKGIASESELYRDVRQLATKITDVRETAKRMAVEAFQERGT